MATSRWKRAPLLLFSPVFAKFMRHQEARFFLVISEVGKGGKCAWKISWRGKLLLFSVIVGESGGGEDRKSFFLYTKQTLLYTVCRSHSCGLPLRRRRRRRCCSPFALCCHATYFLPTIQHLLSPPFYSIHDHKKIPFNFFPPPCCSHKKYFTASVKYFLVRHIFPQN